MLKSILFNHNFEVLLTEATVVLRITNKQVPKAANNWWTGSLSYNIAKIFLIFVLYLGICLLNLILLFKNFFLDTPHE